MKKCLKIIAIFLALICLTGCSNLSIKDWSVKKQAINYLCEKYNAEPEDFKLVDYRRAHLGSEAYMFFFEKPVIIDYAFEFEYNDKTFFVIKSENGFYDDYQLEDIELWCTEWLQENIDSRIIGFGLWTTHIEVIYNTLGCKYETIFSEEDAKAIIGCYENEEDIVGMSFHVYFYEEDLSDDEIVLIKEQIKTKIQDICLNGSENCYVFCYKNINHSIDKPYDFPWINVIGD